MKMGKSRIYANFLNWGIWILLAVGLLSLQTAPGLFAVFGVKPLLLFPLATTFAFFHKERAAGGYAIFVGALWDVASGKALGFSSILLLIICTSISLLILYLVKQNLINCILLTTGGLLFYDLVYYLFYFLIWGKPGVWVPLLFHLLPTFVYTIAITPLFYFAVHFLIKKLTTAD